MGETKGLNIKDQTYYYIDDMTHIRNFHSNLLKIDQKHYKDDDIYYINCITIKKFSDCENIHNVNTLCLRIHSATGYFKEENGKKYLILDLIEKYEEVFSGIRSEIKTINGGKELFYEENYARIDVNTNDNMPLNKQLKFPALTIIIRIVSQEGTKLYPPVYLDECLYESQKMFPNSFFWYTI